MEGTRALAALLPQAGRLGAQRAERRRGMIAEAADALPGISAHVDGEDVLLEGRELRLSLNLEDDRETPARIAAIMPLVDAAVQGLTGTVGTWQVGSLVMIRSRLVRNGAGRWVAVMDYRVRVLEV